MHTLMESINFVRTIGSDTSRRVTLHSKNIVMNLDVGVEGLTQYSPMESVQVGI